MIKKPAFLFLLFAVVILSPLLAIEKKVRVTADRAPIYAEAHPNSYRIEIVKKGTILTIFSSGELEAAWYYVSYRSKRWNSQVTGFIQASLVEEVGDKPEEKIPKISVEEMLVVSSPLPLRPFATLQIFAEEEKPRIFMSTLEREHWAEDAQPKIAKPKVEQIMVTESVGISPVLASKSYALPEPGWDVESRPFLSIDTKPAAVVHVEKEDKALSDITKKIPEKLQERQPSEVLAIKPETEEKEESKEKVQAEPKPEKKQVVPQVKPKKPRLPGERSLLTMSVGYGPSAGSGVGGFVQLNTRKGVSFHLGAGYYPTTYFYSEHEWATNQVLFSVGIKYYLPLESDWLRTFVDIQYGGVSVEAVRIFTGFWQYQYVYENVQKTLYGPSFLAGIELRLMDNVGLNGAIGLSYNTTEWDYWERDYFLTAEVGLLVYLW